MFAVNQKSALAKIRHVSSPAYCGAGNSTIKNKLFTNETSMRVEFFFKESRTKGHEY